MTGFETFDIRSWMTDGLTRHLSGDGKSTAPKRPRANGLVVGVSMLAAMVAANDMTLPAASAAQTEFISPDYFAAEPSNLIDHPRKYWASLSREVSTWQVAEEYTGEDPPTLF